MLTFLAVNNLAIATHHLQNEKTSSLTLVARVGDQGSLFANCNAIHETHQIKSGDFTLELGDL
jgi:hypothetical protein